MVGYRVIAASVMFLSLVGCQTASGVSYRSLSGAAPGTVGFMASGQQVVAPLGYLVFCKESPAECAVPVVEPVAAVQQVVELQPNFAGAASPPSRVMMSSTPVVDERDLAESYRMQGPLVPLTRPHINLVASVAVDEVTEETDASVTVNRAVLVSATSALVAPLAMQDNNLVTGSNAVGPVSLTSARWQELTGVNSRINQQVRSVRDDVLYQRAEWWSYPTNNAGDCEDYALLKRKILMEQGWPASSLLITVAKQWNGEGHAVLIAVTDKGEFVLDNMERNVVGWRDAPYQWVMRQSQDDPNIWVNLDPSRMRAPIARPEAVAAVSVSPERI